MGLLIAVTGTPGSGKSTFARRLGKSLGDSLIIEINELVKRYRLYSKKDRFGTMIVDLGRLNRNVAGLLRKKKTCTVILVGHLAPELRLRYRIAVVTRCRLGELVKRLEKRKYPREMMVENIASEAIDYCGTRISGKCSELYEAGTDADKRKLIKYIVSVSKGSRAKRPKLEIIDELHGLTSLIKSGNKYGL